MKDWELKELVGKNIKFFRFRRQLSQAELAERVNISITSLSNIERGRNFPQATTLCDIAGALDIAVWELFKSEDDAPGSLIDRFAEDITTHVGIALETVRSRYRRNTPAAPPRNPKQ